MATTIKVTISDDLARSLRGIGRVDGKKKHGRALTLEEVVLEALEHHRRDRIAIIMR